MQSPTGFSDESSRFSRGRSPLRWTAGVLILAAVYFAAAKLGLSLAFAAEQVSSVWPPAGIALAALLLFGFRFWPGVFLGAFLANATANEPIFTACGIAIGNTLEAVLGAWLLRRVVGFDNAVERVRDAIGLIVASVFATMLSATMGVASLCLGGVYLPELGRIIEWSDFGSLWWEWWLGDAMGILVVVPLLLTWFTTGIKWRGQRAMEMVALFGGLIAAGSLAFLGDIFAGLGRTSLAYVAFPFVTWSALRFGQPATTTVTFVAASLAIWATNHGLGPFGNEPPHERLLLLQVFMGVVAVTALLLGAALAERKHAEAGARTSEERLRAAAEELQTLIDLLPVGIFIAQDASCSKITMNPAGAAMLRTPQHVNPSKTGAGAGELSFRLVKEGREIPGEDLPMQRAARTGVAVRGEEMDVIHADGTTTTLYEYASPLFNASGTVRGCVGVFVDITERKRAEEALQEADRRKDEFLATLAHELRNPLAPIRSGVELLRLKEPRDPEVREVLEIVNRQVQQIIRLVDDLLDVSRVTRGKIRLQLEMIDLAAVVAQAVETSRPLCQSRQHELTVSMPGEALLLHADSTRLAQVFGNLLNNAAKYTERGGHIALAATREGRQAVVRIRDSGKGINPEMLSRVFEMFAQDDQSLANSEGGLGIGLTLVRQLVEMHSGSVQAISEGQGKGSEFVVRLPLASPAEADAASADAQPVDSSDTATAVCRVLVVDDNVDAARGLELVLRMAGHIVHTAHSGCAALGIVESLRLDVALLDIGLPEMDGYELARRIRREVWGKNLLLIAVTGRGQAEDRQLATEAGFDFHLTKPVDRDELLSLLRITT